MSSRKSESGFLRKLAWTVVLALVFSAGLITGQRLLDSGSQPPLVSVSSKAANASPSPGSSEEGDEEASRPVFSFYDRLSKGIESSDDESGADQKAKEPSESAPSEKETSESSEQPSADEDEATPADSEKTAERGSGQKKAEPSDNPEKSEKSATKYTLQVSAYPSMERARARVRTLSNKGLDAHVVSAKVPDKGTYYRVRIGNFRSMDAAKKFQNELSRKRGVETFVTPL